MLQSKPKPLLSLVIVAFQQEAYIKEAMEGAVGQTYSPLEIIVSDDCSRDGTFQTIQEFAANYRGPHKIKAIQTPQNSGLCQHVNFATGHARGELILIAAGDDVSLPHRAEWTHKAWENAGRRPTSIWGNSITIDAMGKEIGDTSNIPNEYNPGFENILNPDPLEFLIRRTPAVFGCSHAISPSLFGKFGPLSPKNVMEDFQLGFRSVLAGQMLYLDTPLVKYRRHENNISAGQLDGIATDLSSFQAVEDKRRRTLDQFSRLFAALEMDLEHALKTQIVSTGNYDRIKQALNQQQEYTELRKRTIGASMLDAMTLAWKLWKNGAGPRNTLKVLPRMLPHSIYRASVIWANRIKRATGSPYGN